MPIRPEMRPLYPPPPEWRDIRRSILARAGNRCEQCRWPNRVHRAAADGSGRLIRVILTIAHHPDPTPSNCDPSNLLALCQRCHNRLDAPMRARNAAATRARKAAAQ